jgi:hypothetical protein
MAATVPTDDLATAIEAGLAHLAGTQLPTGEFQTFTGPRPELVDSIPFTKSPYITSYIGHALTHLPASGMRDKIQQGIADFLEAEEEPDGTWNFQGRGNWRLPADLDTTVCAAAALLTLGRREPRSLYGLLMQVVRLTQASPGGPYYTYIGVNEHPGIPVFAPVTQELDVLVNVNVVFLCGLLGIAVPGATDFLLSNLHEGVFSGQDRYYISSHFQAYTLTRAYADGNVQALGPAVPALLEHLRTATQAPAADLPAFEAACLATSLMNLGESDDVVRPYLEALLASQERDGGWPIWAAGAGFPREWDWTWLERWPDGPASIDRGWCWGSRTMTTALALESLGRWGRRRGMLVVSPRQDH